MRRIRMPVYKDESDEARTTFWRSLERAAAEVAQWPSWKRSYELLSARNSHRGTTIGALEEEPVDDNALRGAGPH
jgi:hypothetical protein